MAASPNMQNVEYHDDEFHAPLDLVHLSRQTMGDSELERELLALFLVQCENCIEALTKQHKPKELADIAHQMKGCAMSVGAWNVAKTAAMLEDSPGELQHIDRLSNQIHLVEAFLKSMQ